MKFVIISFFLVALTIKINLIGILPLIGEIYIEKK